LKQWANIHVVPLVTWMKPMIVKNINEERVQDARWQYTVPVILRYDTYYTEESYKIGPMEDTSDIMVPYWWIIKFGALSGVTDDSDMLMFLLKHCHQHCTQVAVL
jgi:hypothetical protein